MSCGECPICSSPMVSAGQKRSAFSDVRFDLARCPSCHCARVLNPRNDYEAIYDEAYYAGRGADPKVDYVAEIEDPRTIRALEWRAIERLARGLVPMTQQTRWLDLGCGVGGLVGYLRARGYQSVVGFDEGYGADLSASRGVPVLTSAELEEQHGSFDVITSVEVIEHVVEPMVFLQQVADLLAPGGIFIVTTGNVERLGQDLAEWSYVVPDVHVTFLGPTALKHAYGRLGLKPEVPGFQPGHVEMIRFKILKTLGRRRTSPWERLVPWWPLTRLVDRRYGISAMPFARKPYGLDQGSTGTGSHGSARQTSA